MKRFYPHAAELGLDLAKPEDYDYLKKTGVFTVEGMDDVEEYAATKV